MTALRGVSDRLSRSAHPDPDLIRRFLADRDEAAFAALVARHGPMVFGVCRRLTPTRQDAEDAFQAAFLVLACKAASVRPADRLGAWLHGVAVRCARTAAARSRREPTAPDGRLPDRPDRGDPPPDPDLRPVIDDALAALPEKYRAPVVLCHLEGRSRAEAAGLLGWTEGTLSGRLARALDLLARRLSARGVTVPAAGVATALSAWAAPAAVPAALPTSTASAAALLAAGLGLPGPASGDVAALTRKVLRGMSLTRYKLASVLLACSAGVGLLTLAARSWAEPAPSAGRPATARADPPAAPPPKPAARPAAGGWSTRVTLAHDDPVAVVAVGTDLVAIGGEDGNLRLWDGKAGKDPAPLLKGGKAAGLTRSVDRLGFTPDGKYLYIITDGGKALARCEVTGKGRRTYGVRSDQERMIGVSADGETWLERSPGHPKSLLLRPNGWSRANGGRPFETIDFDADLALAVGSPDGKWFAAVTADGTIHVIEADGLKVARKIAVTDLAARAVAFSPDGRLLAVVGENGFARLFDAATGTEARGLDGLEGIVFAVGFSPDGRWVATGAQDGVARVWEARTGKPVAALKGHTDSVRSVAFGPDGKTLVTGSADKTVRVWGFEE